jgi:hypothetical protein
MEKYSLEVENWGDYELVKDFSSVELAKDHGCTNFPQNEWRVFNRTAGRVVHKHDPFSSIEEEASQHLQRYATTDMWRQRYADQAAREVYARQQRGRLAEIAARQRAAQRDNLEARQQRLAGFRFVGQEPSVLAQQPPAAHAVAEAWDDDDWDDWDDDERLDLAREKVNWQQEGF